MRKIINQIEGIKTSDGAGVSLTRIIGSPELNMLDPFLLLDEFGSDNPDDYIAGFPPHPHRGFETITYMLNGKFHHKDNAGNEGFLEDGSVQWMTAGKGVVHSEMPKQTDGLVRGFQLWLNLPKEKKMIEPSYHDISAEQIPCIKTKISSVKIISGEYQNTKGPGKPHTGFLYFDVNIDPGKSFSYDIPEDWNAFIYVYEGSLSVNSDLSKGFLGVLSTSGKLEVNCSDEGANFILVAGEPLREPVARGGPFVMNTRSEILQAFEDYQTGKFGS